MQYSDFGELKEIGSGGYGTVYTAKYKNYLEVENMPETVVLKQFKSFDETPDLFISEVSNNCNVTFSLTLYLFLFNSSEIMPSVRVIHSLTFMESHKTQKQKSI